MALKFPVRRRGIGAFSPAGPAAPRNFVPYRGDAGLARSADELGYQEWRPASGVEEQQGSPYPPNISEEILTELQRPLDPGIDTPTYTNPYLTVMYSVTGLSTTLPTRVLSGNLRRTYLLIQNLGPGNMFLGIGTDPGPGGANVLNLVSTQVYEQIGGGFFLPPNALFPKGLSVPLAFCSPEYISVMVDTAGTNAMVLEGSFSNSAFTGE